MRFKSKLPSPPPLQEGAEPPEVDELLANIDEKYAMAKSLTETLAKISEDLTSTAQTLVDAQKYAQNLREELKTVVFRAEMSDASKAEWNQFHTDIGNKMKVDLREQYEKQCDEIDLLMTDCLKRFEASQSAFVQRQNLLFENQTKNFKENVKQLEENKGVWVSNRNFWILTLLITVLLSATVWFLGKSLTN
jgi:uncharacterized phage infection (PIP) family protein YhgE